MAYQGITIFILFFGISLLDALFTGNWVRAAFWIALGAAFFFFDRSRRERRSADEAERRAE